MTIELISKEDYTTLKSFQRNYPNLTFQNNGYEYPDKRKWDAQTLNAHKFISKVLEKAVLGFSKFEHFKLRDSGEIILRLQYNWSADDENSRINFIGVGYIGLDELYKGFKNEN